MDTESFKAAGMGIAAIVLLVVGLLCLAVFIGALFFHLAAILLRVEERTFLRSIGMAILLLVFEPIFSLFAALIPMLGPLLALIATALTLAPFYSWLHSIGFGRSFGVVVVTMVLQLLVAVAVVLALLMTMPELASTFREHFSP